jgi:hypothetical protein
MPTVCNLPALDDTPSLWMEAAQSFSTESLLISSFDGSKAIRPSNKVNSMAILS